MRICEVKDCGRKHYGLGYCRGHHARITRGGDIGTEPLGKSRRNSVPDEVRFWSKVDTTGDCWNWTGTKNDTGYGAFGAGGVSHYTHRYSYEIKFGEIPSALVIDHMCRNRICVNPDHLQAVTRSENNQNRDQSGTGRSGLRNVAWHEGQQSWHVATRGADGQRHFGGRYPSLEEAEAAAIALRNRVHTNNLADRREVEP